jgi:hypothetical protein
VAVAADAGIQRLVLFHHEPEHDDAALDGVVTAARGLPRAAGHPAEILAAQEGMQLTL